MESSDIYFVTSSREFLRGCMRHYCMCVHQLKESLALPGEGKVERVCRYCRGEVMQHELSQIRFHGGPIPQTKTGC